MQNFYRAVVLVYEAHSKETCGASQQSATISLLRPGVYKCLGHLGALTPKLQGLRV